MNPDRRQVIRSAAGLLVPAWAGLSGSPASAVDVERNHRRRRRRSRQKPPQMFADDVVACFWNRTDKDLGLYFTAIRPGNHVLSRPGVLSAYNEKIDPFYYGTDLELHILSFRSGSIVYTYRVVLENPEIGTADVSIQRWVDGKLDLVMADDLDLDEGRSVTRSDKIVRFQIYRHDDGKIAEDGHDEEYCRFEISLFRA
jgi:hypothetical protein